ncbi:MAG TPA: membrane protein insertase YidC [Mucilaginibacter sp.]|jgi:YidC/Oxa1 family membrane protein insertase|nr:membrane protein insertase YidC [Mucilaginibacter sp.]
MDKNTFTGLFLIMIIMGVSIFIMKPNDADIKKEAIRMHADSVKKGLVPKTAASATKAADTAKTAANTKVDSMLLKQPFGASTVGTEKIVTLENADIIVKLTTLGGKVSSVELKNYKTYNHKPLILFDGDSKNHFGLTFNAGSNSINTDKLYFTPNAGQLKVTGSDSSSVTMRLSYSPTQYIDYIYSLKGSGFKVGLTIKPVGLDQVIAASNTLNINWAASMRKQEMDLEQERRYTTIYDISNEGSIDYLSSSKDDHTDVTDKKLQWVSFQAHFFSGVIIAGKGFDKSGISVNTDVTDSLHSKQMSASFNLTRNADGTCPLLFYFGPNKYDVLKAQGYDLQKQIYMGWAPFALINRFAVLPVFNFLIKFTSNYGLIILGLTLILKLVLSPLTYKSYLSMAKMRVLKPEMDEIKAKVGEDNPTLLQQEYMKLYKKAGVNPLGGCLPLVIQMPIVFAFFRFFPSLFELRGQSFLWMHDLSTYDTVITFAPLPLLGWTHLSVMCLFMTASTLIYTYFNNQISGATGQMKYIGYITPIIFLGALNSYPSGLNYYYFLANMLTFTQQYIIRLMVDDKKIHEQIQENKKKPEVKKKQGGFQARMEEMMRQKQQLPPAKKK